MFAEPSESYQGSSNEQDSTGIVIQKEVSGRIICLFNKYLLTIYQAGSRFWVHGQYNSNLALDIPRGGNPVSLSGAIEGSSIAV